MFKYAGSWKSFYGNASLSEVWSFKNSLTIQIYHYRDAMFFKSSVTQNSTLQIYLTKPSLNKMTMWLPHPGEQRAYLQRCRGGIEGIYYGLTFLLNHRKKKNQKTVQFTYKRVTHSDTAFLVPIWVSSGSSASSCSEEVLLGF